MTGLRVAAMVAAGLLGASCTGPARVEPGRDPRLVRVAEAVSEVRLRALVERLAEFGTRHTLSESSSPARGIGAARQWILDELRTHPRLEAAFDVHHVAAQGRILRDVELRNVIAVLPGRTRRRIYVSAHYDTVSVPGAQIGLNIQPDDQPAADPQLRPDQDFGAPAPGANDNGSGTALTMELARVLAESGIAFDATLVFALWAGEEQGLVGSRAHVQRLAAEQVVVDAVFNNDIVGGSRGGDGVVDDASVRVYSEGPEDSPSRALARYVAQMAAAYVPSHRVRLMAREDRFRRGSDHSSFNAYGFPAIVFREARENFSKQHGPDDTPDGVDARYLAANARVNAVSVAALALAPPPPRVTDDRGVPRLGRHPSGYDARLRWSASPGAVSYRVYWRDTWSNDWQHDAPAGDALELVVPGVSIDDYVFGVAAVGADGHESPVAAYTAPPARRPDVQLVR